jgi:hypothetical protein
MSGAATTERPKTVENIKVLQVGKYGVRVDEKTWFGVNEPLTPTHFQVGEGYKVSVTASKTGKKYINEILGQEVQESAPAAAPAQAVPDAVKAAEAALAKAKTDAEAAVKAQATPKTDARPMRAGFGQPLTEYDMKVQRVINHSSCWNSACAAAPALAQFVTNTTELIAEIRKVAEAGLKFTDQ